MCLVGLSETRKSSVRITGIGEENSLIRSRCANHSNEICGKWLQQGVTICGGRLYLPSNYLRCTCFSKCMVIATYRKLRVYFEGKRAFKCDLVAYYLVLKL